jgi:hypothetical protein
MPEDPIDRAIAFIKGKLMNTKRYVMNPNAIFSK